MSGYRTPKQTRLYRTYLKIADPAVCTFCTVTSDQDRFVDQTKHFNIIKNQFPYSLWDGQEVTDHLMIVPKKHTNNLGSMTLREKAEYVDLLEEYERAGYNIYARAPVSAIRSIPHQHTHLIKAEGRYKKLLFFLDKPYVRFSR